MITAQIPVCVSSRWDCQADGRLEKYVLGDWRDGGGGASDGEGPSGGVGVKTTNWFEE